MMNRLKLTTLVLHARPPMFIKNPHAIDHHVHSRNGACDILVARDIPRNIRQLSHLTFHRMARHASHITRHHPHAIIQIQKLTHNGASDKATAAKNHHPLIVRQRLYGGIPCHKMNYDMAR